MNPARYDSMVSNLTGSATKVFSATPIQEAWSSRAIYAEMVRMGYSMEFTKVEGCLRDLCNQGLVEEDRNHQFQRVTVNRKPPTLRLAKELDMPQEQKDPIKQLEQIATQLRHDASVLIKRAEAIEEAAILAMDAVQQAGAANAQLQQLRALLKGL